MPLWTAHMENQITVVFLPHKLANPFKETEKTSWFLFYKTVVFWVNSGENHTFPGERRSQAMGPEGSQAVPVKERNWLTFLQTLSLFPSKADWLHCFSLATSIIWSLRKFKQFFLSKKVKTHLISHHPEIITISLVVIFSCVPLCRNTHGHVAF